MAARVEQLWPLFRVRDMATSMTFYCDRLGFERVGEARDDDGGIYWCRVERDGASIMLQREDDDAAPAAARDAFYLVCDDVDAIFEELTARGLELEEPTVAFYGMKQLHVPEPDGRELVFESRTEAWSE